MHSDSFFFSSFLLFHNSNVLIYCLEASLVHCLHYPCIPKCAYTASWKSRTLHFDEVLWIVTGMN